MLCVKKGSQARSWAAVDPQAAREQLSRTNTDTAEMLRQLFKGCKHALLSELTLNRLLQTPQSGTEM